MLGNEANVFIAYVLRYVLYCWYKLCTIVVLVSIALLFVYRDREA